MKRLIMIAVTVFAIATGVLVGNANQIQRTGSVAVDAKATNQDQQEFKTNLLNVLNKANAQTLKESKAGKTPTSPYALIFQQPTASAVNPNSTTFSPKITSGGLNYNGTTFSVIVENNSSLHNQSFIVNGLVDNAGHISKVKVDAL